MLLVMLYTLRWSYKPCMRNIIFLALAIGLGMSSKLSVAYMAPATALVFLWKLLHTRGWICSLLPQFIVFALICLPLGLWWYIRCYVLFGLLFGYVPALSTDSSQYLGTSYTACRVCLTCRPSSSNICLSLMGKKVRLIWSTIFFWLFSSPLSLKNRP